MEINGIQIPDSHVWYVFGELNLIAARRLQPQGPRMMILTTTEDARLGL